MDPQHTVAYFTPPAPLSTAARCNVYCVISRLMCSSKNNCPTARPELGCRLTTAAVPPRSLAASQPHQALSTAEERRRRGSPDPRPSAFNVHKPLSPLLHLFHRTVRRVETRRIGLEPTTPGIHCSNITGAVPRSHFLSRLVSPSAPTFQFHRER